MSAKNPFDDSGEPASNSNPDGLGDLAQSSRRNELGGAKGALIVVGVLTMAINGFMFGNAENEVRELNLLNPGEVVTAVKMIYGSAFLLGLALCLCGLFVRKWPVPMTLCGLILYLLGTAAFALLDPMSLLQGVIVKIFIVILLVKSVKTAFAYQQDRTAGLV